MPSAEWFEIVDEAGRVLGQAPREQCHTDPGLMHQVAHVLVFDKQGRWFLQKRSSRKDIQPGKWDTAVGGHFQPGETPLSCARREMAEELGVRGAELTWLYRYIMRSSRETEMVFTFQTLWEDEIITDPNEIECGKFWTETEIRRALGTGVLTPNFEDEFRRWQNQRALA